MKFSVLIFLQRSADLHHRPKRSTGISLDHAPVLGWVKAPSDVTVLSKAATVSQSSVQWLLNCNCLVLNQGVCPSETHWVAL